MFRWICKLGVHRWRYYPSGKPIFDNVRACRLCRAVQQYHILKEWVAAEWFYEELEKRFPQTLEGMIERDRQRNMKKKIQPTDKD